MLDLNVKAEGINDMRQFLLAMQGKANRPTAVAMTRTGAKVRQEVRNQTPRFVDRPTRWTMNSTFLKPAKPTDLSVTVGFKDYSSSGVPAAQYMQPIAAGGNRTHKPYERRLQSRGILRSYEYAVPTGIAPASFNQYGNLPASQYLQILSQLRALREVGSTQNATGSRRSRAKRKRLSYFVAEINGNRGIYARQAGSRIVTPVFWFVATAPKYEPQFPIQEIMRKTFQRHWPAEFERAIEDEMRYWARKG